MVADPDPLTCRVVFDPRSATLDHCARHDRAAPKGATTCCDTDTVRRIRAGPQTRRPPTREIHDLHLDRFDDFLTPIPRDAEPRGPGDEPEPSGELADLYEREAANDRRLPR